MADRKFPIVPVIAVAAAGFIGYRWWKDRAVSSPGGSLASSDITVEQPLANTVSDTSYVDPTGGMDYVDNVPVSITSPTGFTAQDYNYGTVTESPLASNGGYDLVADPNGNGANTIVPTGLASVASLHSVVG